MTQEFVTLPREVVEQALKALFMYKPMVTGVTFQHGLEAMQALRAALEQPQVEQEPVAWCWTGRKGWIEYGPEEHDLYNCDPLYLHPQPPRQPLTNAEIADLLIDIPVLGTGYFLRIARAIEAAHNIK